MGRFVIARAHRRFRFDNLADPASLPLIVMLLGHLLACGVAGASISSRGISNMEADRFGLELTHENRAMGELFAGEITQHHELAEWDGFFLVFRASHPSNGDRIRFANDYHPWDDGKPPVYGDVCRPVR